MCLCVYVSLSVNTGNPFLFMVIDPLKVAVRGDGLGLIKANQSASFVISAPAADISDLDVVITGIRAFWFIITRECSMIMRLVASTIVCVSVCLSCSGSNF